MVPVNMFDNNICIVCFEPKVKAKKSTSSMLLLNVESVATQLSTTDQQRAHQM